MIDRLGKNIRQAHQNAHGDLTNGPTCYSLMVTKRHNMANHAECVNTPHGSNPTLVSAVTGLLRIIQDRETSVLRGIGGPIDSSVSVGRRVVPVGGRA
jgi:hypothetical protein